MCSLVVQCDVAASALASQRGICVYVVWSELPWARSALSLIRAVILLWLASDRSLPSASSAAGLLAINEAASDVRTLSNKAQRELNRLEAAGNGKHGQLLFD